VKAGWASSDDSGGSSTLRVGSASARTRRMAPYFHGIRRRALCEASCRSISCRQRRACHACTSRERALASLHPALRTPRRRLGSEEGGDIGRDSSAGDNSPKALGVR